MCTAICLCAGSHYFGRTLDLDRSYGEKICIMPRHFPLPFSRQEASAQHYAVIGMAVVAEGYPLFYDGANEKGLAMAGLNFPGNAYYPPEKEGCDNVSPYEFIPWILSRCASVEEARQQMQNLNLADIPMNDQIPLAPLHWMISGRDGCIVVESTAQGLHIYNNPVQVMTNNPPFPYQRFHLNNFRSLSVSTPPNSFSRQLSLPVYCQGLGGLGLPGDMSSMSRFVRSAFYLHNAVWEPEEESCVGQFFHLLDSVTMSRGCCLTDAGQWDITVYAGCINTDTGCYYYTTYDNRQICRVDLRKADLEGDSLQLFSLLHSQHIRYLN